MFRRETSEQLENSQQPMRDVTLLLLGPNASRWRGSDAFLRRLLAFGFGLITGMTFLCVSGLASACMAKRTWLFIALYHFMLLSVECGNDGSATYVKRFIGLLVFLSSIFEDRVKALSFCTEVIQKDSNVLDIDRPNLFTCPRFAFVDATSIVFLIAGFSQPLSRVLTLKYIRAVRLF